MSRAPSPGLEVSQKAQSLPTKPEVDLVTEKILPRISLPTWDSMNSLNLATTCSSQSPLTVVAWLGWRS